MTWSANRAADDVYSLLMTGGILLDHGGVLRQTALDDNPGYGASGLNHHGHDSAALVLCPVADVVVDCKGHGAVLGRFGTSTGT